MKSSSNKAKKPDSKKASVTTHLTNLHQRLYQSLNLGFRYSDDKEREWHTNDVQTQRLVIRSISAFLDDISSETLRTPLVKNAISDVVKAMGSVLRAPNETVLTMATEAVVKLVSAVPSSMLQPHAGHLIHPLPSLLSNHQSQVALMSATALNVILLNLSVKREKEVWEILVKHDVVTQVISNLEKLSEKDTAIEYFLEMTSLLSSIMLLWPPSRYAVWSNAKLYEVMEILFSKPDASVKAAVLQFYSALALCGNGAQMVMEDGELFVQKSVECMGKSQPYSVRILAFKVAQRLMANEDLCSKVLSFSCEPLVKSIICAMSYSSVHHSNVSNQEVSLAMEACRLALVTRWPGNHHGYLWKLGVLKALLNLLSHNFLNVNPHQLSCSVTELITISREALNANFLLELRAYVWDIIGWLSAQREEDFNPQKDGNELHMRVLIGCACVAFVDSTGRERLLRQADRTYTFRSISAAKATLMMMYSPCKYIASQARLVLSELLRFEGEEHYKKLLKSMHFVYSEDTARMPDECEMLISLIGLTCYSGLPQFYRRVVRRGGIRILLAFVRWWLGYKVHSERVSLSPHLKAVAKGRTCCTKDIEDCLWEGREFLLLLSFWSLAELINCHEAEGLEVDIFCEQTIYEKESFIKDVQDIFVDTTSSGLRWHCSYLLSFLGFYGFPTKLGKKIASILPEKEYSDLYLILRDGQCLSVHKVVLLIRCPSLLPLDDSSDEETSIFNSSSARQAIKKCPRTKKEVNLSAQVDEQAILKLLEFVYSGCLQAGRDDVLKLKMLAKHCKMQPLLRLLCNKRPKWATSIPSVDLTIALGPSGYHFSDIILEAKSSENIEWTCACCSFHVPHIHAHKFILGSSCEYMRALFLSGMQESRSHLLKVPVSWEALSKLVVWVYSNDMPKPVLGCIWDNLDLKKKMLELHPYIELCWLAEYWFIDDVLNECSSVIASFLDSPELSIELIQVAANFSQWELVNVAANIIAPVYSNLRCSGELDVLDEGIIEIIRLASVRLSQERLGINTS